MIVVDGGVSYFMAGSTTYTQQALLEQTVDGVSPDRAEALRTLGRILTYAKSRPTVYLPSHDPESMNRLNSAETVPSQTTSASE